MVRAKFVITKLSFTKGVRVKSKDEHGNNVYGPCRALAIEASPVYHNGDPNHENQKFWEASPSGKLELNVVNAAVFDEFQLDQEFYLDMTPVGEAPKLA